MPKPLKIYFIPHAALYQKSAKVMKFNDELRALMDDMAETVRHFEGVGIAANQIGLPIRTFIVNSDACLKEGAPQQHGGKVLKMINPVITARSDELYHPSEACLSLPSVSADVVRNEWVDCEYFDENGNKQAITKATGLLGQCIQHEYDHIQGKVITDYLSSLKRERANAKVAKFVKHNTIEKDDELVDARIVYRNFL